MGFKLGTERGNYAVSGEIRTKMRFHQEAGGDASVPGTPVIRMPLEPGVKGEANMDGSIYISDEIVPDRITAPESVRPAPKTRGFSPLKAWTASSSACWTPNPFS